MIPAVWYQPHLGSISTGIRPEATLEVIPSPIARDCILDRIAINVTIVGTAGAVIRLGIWEDDGSGGYPGKLILDAGTVVGDSGTGVKAITISQPVQAGLIWVGAAIQGAAGTRPQTGIYSTVFNPLVGDQAATPTMGGYHIAWSEAGVSGAFGATFTGTKTFSGAASAISLRASS
jgi:hypothetical protein